ncbi:unnamed protein product [Effrenium voratum]|nr:unnamed protein product [Effrenium voratum]
MAASNSKVTANLKVRHRPGDARARGFRSGRPWKTCGGPKRQTRDCAIRADRIARRMHRTLAAQRRSTDAPRSHFEGKAHLVNLAELGSDQLDQVITTWMVGKMVGQKPVAFCMLWNRDRHADQEHPVAALLFADASRSVLLRTHLTRQWLPSVVQRLIEDRMVLKICSSHTPDHKRKLQHCFSLELKNFAVISSLAEARGVETSLERLAARFGLRWRVREDCIYNSDWEAKELQQQQKQLCVEYPYLLYKTWEKLWELPLVDAPELISVGILAVKDGWEEQGVRRRHDGLYCDLCLAGPVGSTEQMEQHVQGKKHQSKAQPPESAESILALSPELRDEGVIVYDFLSESYGQYFCEACGVGPFHDLEGVHTHVNGKKHAASRPGERKARSEVSPAILLRARLGMKALPRSFLRQESPAELLRAHWSLEKRPRLSGFENADLHGDAALMRLLVNAADDIPPGARVGTRPDK